MATEPRTDEQVRAELAAERERLVDALADLQAGVRGKRRLATAVAGALAVGAAVKVGRRFRSG